MNFQGYISVTSNDLGESGSFKNVLPGELFYSNDYFSVGLREIYLPKEWKVYDDNYIVAYDSQIPIKFYKVLNYKKLDDILNEINNKLTEWKVGINEIKYVNNRIVIKSSLNKYLMMTKDLASLLGFNFYVNHTNEKFPSLDKFTLKQFQERYVRNDKIVSDFSAEIIDRSFVYVHGDFVKHHLTGEKFNQLLKVIPTNQLSSDYIYYESENPIFYPIYSNTIKSLEITFTDCQNLPIKFEEKSNVFIVLEIRRSKYEQF